MSVPAKSDLPLLFSTNIADKHYISHNPLQDLVRFPRPTTDGEQVFSITHTDYTDSNTSVIHRTV